jgi:hypothetical protein
MRDRPRPGRLSFRALSERSITRDCFKAHRLPISLVRLDYSMPLGRNVEAEDEERRTRADADYR